LGGPDAHRASVEEPGLCRSAVGVEFVELLEKGGGELRGGASCRTGGMQASAYSGCERHGRAQWSDNREPCALPRSNTFNRCVDSVDIIAVGVSTTALAGVGWALDKLDGLMCKLDGAGREHRKLHRPVRCGGARERVNVQGGVCPPSSRTGQPGASPAARSECRRATCIDVVASGVDRQTTPYPCLGAKSW
jgi:hypothetical protein